MKSGGKYQQGSALIVVIVAIAVAVVGSLGFVLWQNVINTSPESTQDANTAQPEETKQANLGNTQEVSQYGTTLSFQYPDGWAVSQDNTSISSPDNSLTLFYAVRYVGPIGGTCGGIYTVRSIDTATVAGIANAEYGQNITADESTGSVSYGFGLLTKGAADNVKIGDDACTSVGSFGSGMIKTGLTTYVSELDSDEDVIVMFYGTINNLPAENMTVTDVEAVFASENFKTARDIFTSATLKTN